jgi:hypothetical protein
MPLKHCVPAAGCTLNLPSALLFADRMVTWQELMRAVRALRTKVLATGKLILSMATCRKVHACCTMHWWMRRTHTNTSKQLRSLVVDRSGTCNWHCATRSPNLVSISQPCNLVGLLANRKQQHLQPACSPLSCKSSVMCTFVARSLCGKTVGIQTRVALSLLLFAVCMRCLRR